MTRKTSFNMDKLKKKAADAKNRGQKTNKYQDERFWKLTPDPKTKTGKAVVRFLPGIIETDDDLPYVEMFKHSFNGPGGKFYANCLNSIGKPCPICATQKPLYESGNEADKKIASSRKKQQRYIANIYIVDDTNNPENNGKVFLYDFPPTVFTKLLGQMEVAEADDGEVQLPTVQPFMLDATGADFIIETQKKGDGAEDWQVDYDLSRYKLPKLFSVKGDALDAVLDAQFAVKEFVDPSNTKLYKTEADLLSYFDKVVKGSTVKNSLAEADEDNSDDEPEETPEVKAVQEKVDNAVKSTKKEEKADTPEDIEEKIRKLLGKK